MKKLESIKFNQMTTEELKKAFAVIQHQNLAQMRDYIQRMYFLNRGAITKKKLIENVQAIHQFNSDFVETVIKIWVDFALIFEDVKGVFKVCTDEFWNLRDEKIIEERFKKEQHEPKI